MADCDQNESMSFDSKKFSDALDKAVRGLANDALDTTKAGAEAAVEAVRGRYQSQSTAEVNEMIQEELKARNLPIQIPAEYTADWAEGITKGQKITVDVEHI
jgi:hypothetical protein